jgi:hypothetical protein
MTVNSSDGFTSTAQGVLRVGRGIPDPEPSRPRWMMWPEGAPADWGEFQRQLVHTRVSRAV